MSKTDQSILGFVQIETRDSLEAYLRQQSQETGEPIRGLTFDSSVDPLQIIQQCDISGIQVEVDAHEEFSQVSLIRSMEGKGKEYNEEGVRIVEGDFYILDHSDEMVYTALSVCDSSFFEDGIRHFISSLPSPLSKSYISTEEMRSLCDTISERHGSDILVKTAVIKSPSKKTELQYDKTGDTRYFELFNSEKVAEKDYFVDKLEFSLPTKDDGFRSYISRDGESRYLSGPSSIYFNYILPQFASTLSDNARVFEDKSREYGTRDANSIAISYSDGELQGTDQNIRLIDALEGLSNYSVTVYHKNPYMHASVLDYSDGSSADVFLTTDSRISIVPGFNASKKSLTQITEQINRQFKEGDVSDSPESERSAEDIFTRS